MLPRALAEAVFAEAVAACDPAARVRAALADVIVERWLGIAVGKAALAMARGAGPVHDGVVIAPADDGRGLPAGWRLVLGPHPVPDARSLAAAVAAREVAEEARAGDLVVALISGGASALMEEPADGVTLDELRATIGALMAAGAPIAELNAVRGALSRIKAGGLVVRCATRVMTLAVSDVVGDDLATIGSGPTIAPNEPLAPRAREILNRYGLPLPSALAAPRPAPPPRIGDTARVIAPLRAFADAAADALEARGLVVARSPRPLAGDVEAVADALVGDAPAGVQVAWGEPTVVLPADHGTGGRAQQLALALARRLRGTARAALVAGSDGADGPAPPGRTAPAGAFVDGGTWDAVRAAGLDPDLALARRDAGSALAAVGALVVSGPTGVNHADLVLLG